MPREQVAPTRSNYLKMQRSLERARRGYELLERKRQILVMELMDNIEAARTAQERVEQLMEDAFQRLRRAALASGAERLVRESLAVPTAHSVRIRTRSVMGVDVPEVTFEPARSEMPFGLLAGAGGADRVRRCFAEALDAVVELAEIENAVLRLAHEVKKTQRRVHALENTFIPRYEETVKFIEDTLAEREREELVIMKKVKAMH